MKTKLYLDNSTLEVVAKCDTATILGAYHELSSREESAPLICGQAVHEVLAAHFSGVDAYHALEHLGTYVDVGSQLPVDNRLSYENVHKIMAYWLEANRLQDFPFRPIVSGIEKPLTATLYEDDDYEINLVGLLDLPARKLSNNQMVIIDHKTTGKVNYTWKEKFYLGSQVDSYLWLVQQNYPTEHVTEMYINAIELSSVPNSNRKCAVHGVTYSECGDLHPNHELMGPFTRSPELIESWRQSAIGLASRYVCLLEEDTAFEDLHYQLQQGRFNGSCSYCTFQQFCRLGRPIDLIDRMLVSHPWRSLLEEKVKNYDTPSST